MATIDERVERLESHVNKMLEVVRSLQNATAHMVSAMEMLRGRIDQIRPPIHNCPKCTRKIGPDDKSCGMCGFVLAA